jgi:hypothetical protein
MIIDAFLVALLVFSTSPAHIWAGALILPLASGTAPACKGVLLDMVPAARKSDALSAIALVEVRFCFSSHFCFLCPSPPLLLVEYELSNTSTNYNADRRQP